MVTGLDCRISCWGGEVAQKKTGKAPGRPEAGFRGGGSFLWDAEVGGAKQRRPQELPRKAVISMGRAILR